MHPLKKHTISMNYYICDDITWKRTLSLLKNDSSGQRVYSTLWQMTRDVLMLSITLSAMASIVLLVFGSIKLIIDFIVVPTLPAEFSILDVVLFSVVCPATFIVPLTWVLAYFGWYKSFLKINIALHKFMDSFPEAEDIKRNSLVSYRFHYHQQELHAIFVEKKGSCVATVAQGNLVLMMPYQDTQDRSTGVLFEEIKEYLQGKLYASFAMDNECLLFSFDSQPVPDPKMVKQIAETLIYLKERFELQDAETPVEE